MGNNDEKGGKIKILGGKNGEKKIRNKYRCFVCKDIVKIKSKIKEKVLKHQDSATLTTCCLMSFSSEREYLASWVT